MWHSKLFILQLWSLQKNIKFSNVKIVWIIFLKEIAWLWLCSLFTIQSIVEHITNHLETSSARSVAGLLNHVLQITYVKSLDYFHKYFKNFVHYQLL
jgi:hypothetical protein